MGRMALGAAAVAGALALGGGAARGAFEKPKITEPPSISGTAQVGQTLTETGAEWSGPNGTTATFTWLRCGDSSLTSCAVIDGATGTSYDVVDADKGERLRVWLAVVRGRHHRDDAVSGPTAAVTAPPPPPKPKPTPSPTPAATPILAPTPTATPDATPEPFDVAAPPAAAPVPTAGAVLQETSTKPRMLRPFPVVRIKGRLTRNGARVTVLSVTAPRGARVTVRCRGRGCPRTRWRATASALVRLRPFERVLPAGVRITVLVTKPGFIGKHTVLMIRRGRPPLRSDRCVTPGSSRPIACPAA